MDKDRIMTIKEVADYIKVNEKTVLKLARFGELPASKVDNQWRFHLVAVDHYLQKQLVDADDEDLDQILSTKEHLIPLSRLTSDELIELDLKAKNKKEVLAELAELAFQTKITPAYKPLHDALKDREKMLTTAVGQGVAIPHPRDPQESFFKKPNIIIARSKAGIEYEAPDKRKVHLFFMPCAPNEFVHIRLIAKISKLLHIPNVIERFKNTTSKEDIIRILLAFEQLQFLPNQDVKNMQETLKKQRKKK